MAIIQFILTLKAMVYYILKRPYSRRFSFMLCPLSEITFLRSADFIKLPFMTHQRTHNMNRMWHVNRNGVLANLRYGGFF